MCEYVKCLMFSFIGADSGIHINGFTSTGVDRLNKLVVCNEHSTCTTHVYSHRVFQQEHVSINKCLLQYYTKMLDLT
jgi:hypothetical protein